MNNNEQAAPAGNGRGTMRNDNGVSWQVIVVATSLVGLAGGGMWAVSQTQLSSLEKLASARWDALAVALDLLRKDNDGKDSRIAAELTRREIEIKAQLKTLQDELDRRRGEFVTQYEFKQHEGKTSERDIATRERLRTIEQTRPTTGELQGTTKAAEVQIGRLDDRIKALEQMNMLTQKKVP